MEALKFERLKWGDPRIAEVCLPLYAQSFPLHEQRRWASQERALADGAYHYDAIYASGVFAGLMLYWEAGAFTYVEHFCMVPELRSRGLGSEALAALCRRGGTVILEIDPPVDALSLRRKGFYKRAGFVANSYPHVHPPYRDGYQGHALVVMSAPNPLSPSEYDAFARYLNTRVMGV